MRCVFVFIIALASFVHGYAQDSENQARSKSPKLKVVQFAPPADTVKVKTLELTGVEAFHRMKVSRLQAAHERVLEVPL